MQYLVHAGHFGHRFGHDGGGWWLGGLLGLLLFAAIAAGGLLCGTPEEVCEQLELYERTGVDQVAFGFPNDLSHDEARECIELFGERVIPEFDRDPVHSTTRYRQAVSGG